MSPSTARIAERSGAAPAARRVGAQALFEAGTLLRNGEQLLVSLVLPTMVLVGLHLSSAPSLGPGKRLDVGVPGVLALCVISASFTAQAIATGFDRRYNVLRYLGTTPLGRGGLLAGKVGATLVVQVVQWLAIGAVAVALGWRPVLAGVAVALVFLVLGTWTFVALAMLLGGTVRAEGVLALANLMWVVFLTVGGVLVPATQLPDAAQPVVTLLPSAALGDGLRAAFLEARLAPGPILVLLGWALAATLAARRLFRWSD